MRLVSCILLALLAVCPAFAKSPDQVKSAFLYQIAKFTKFNDQVNPPPISFCFYDLDKGPGAFLKDRNELQINKKPIMLMVENKPDSLFL